MVPASWSEGKGPRCRRIRTRGGDETGPASSVARRGADSADVNARTAAAIDHASTDRPDPSTLPRLLTVDDVADLLYSTKYTPADPNHATPRGFWLKHSGSCGGVLWFGLDGNRRGWTAFGTVEQNLHAVVGSPRR